MSDASDKMPMTDRITQTIAAIQDLVGACTPTPLFNPDVPTDTSLVYPFVMAFPREGEINFYSAGVADMPSTIYVDFHVNRNYLAGSAKTAWEYILPFAAKLRDDPTLAGSVEEIDSATWTYGEVPWGETFDIGVRFTLVVKYNV